MREIHKRDNTFRKDNWIMNFPFNYYFLDGNNSIDLIRKLAVINALYGTFFFREDDVLDEYQAPKAIFKNYILKMCDAHTLRNLAIGQLLHLCGGKIYGYIFEYEKQYYHALIKEKSHQNITLENMLEKKNLIFLGYKVVPLLITFCAFCILINKIDNLQICENMLINYHVAHQLNDDLIDLKSDIHTPDQSYIIRACKASSKTNEITLTDIKGLLFQENYDYKIVAEINKYLALAELEAEKLNFQIFLKQIHRLKSRVSNYQRNK